jgi:pimeloyl-ACP methyl ester carboxylesterase
MIIRTPQAEFYAEASGAAPRAIFLHGFSGDLRTWDLQWPGFGTACPALRYDQRGFGLSPLPGGPYSHADDLHAVVNACGIERCDLIGVSQGGAVALNFALDHPERVRRLVLISTGIVGWEWSASWRALWRPIVTHARAGRMAEARHMWWQHPLFDSTRGTAAGPELHAAIERYSGAHWVRLHALKAPVLLLTGGRDFEDFRLIAGVIEAAARDVRRVDVPALGHLLQLEDPVGTTQRIVDFLA